jgi:hypothetical protein
MIKKLKYKNKRNKIEIIRASRTQKRPHKGKPQKKPVNKTKLTKINPKKI